MTPSTLTNTQYSFLSHTKQPRGKARATTMKFTRRDIQREVRRYGVTFNVRLRTQRQR